MRPSFGKQKDKLVTQGASFFFFFFFALLCFADKTCLKVLRNIYLKINKVLLLPENSIKLIRRVTFIILHPIKDSNELLASDISSILTMRNHSLGGSCYVSSLLCRDWKSVFVSSFNVQLRHLCSLN